MCTELLLAIIYFSIIFIVNFLLIKLLISYIKNIFYFLKIQNILYYCKKKEKKVFEIFYSISKKKLQTEFILKNFNTFFEKNDILLIGNIYKSFSVKLQSSKNFENYFFQLLRNQYLPNE